MYATDEIDGEGSVEAIGIVPGRALREVLRALDKIEARRGMTTNNARTSARPCTRNYSSANIGSTARLRGRSPNF
jgi:hypothetical protein